MSLWPINDRATAQIMEAFYQQLATGQSKDEALRKAKLDFLKTADNIQSHPRFWAAFSLIGDPHPIPQSTSIFPWVLGVGSLIGILLVIRLYLRNKRTKMNA